MRHVIIKIMIACRTKKIYKWGHSKKLTVILDRNNIEDLLKLLGKRLSSASRAKLRYKADQCIKHDKKLVLKGLGDKDIYEGEYVMFNCGYKKLISYTPENFERYFEIIEV